MLVPLVWQTCHFSVEIPVCTSCNPTELHMGYLLAKVGGLGSALRCCDYAITMDDPRRNHRQTPSSQLVWHPKLVVGIYKYHISLHVYIYIHDIVDISIYITIYKYIPDAYLLLIHPYLLRIFDAFTLVPCILRFTLDSWSLNPPFLGVDVSFDNLRQSKIRRWYITRIVQTHIWMIALNYCWPTFLF